MIGCALLLVTTHILLESNLRQQHQGNGSYTPPGINRKNPRNRCSHADDIVPCPRCMGLASHIAQHPSLVRKSVQCSYNISISNFHSRLDPILFRSLYIDTNKNLSKLLTVLQQKPPNFIRQTVKALYFGSDFSPKPNSVDLIRLCEGVTSLCTLQEFEFSALSQLSLVRFTSGDCYYPRNREVLSHPFFARLTHLEICGRASSNSYLSFHLLPCLTHLAFNWMACNVDQVYVDEELGAISHIIGTCPGLQMLLVLVASREMPASRGLLQQIGSFKVYVGFTQELKEDWLDHLRGEDSWGKAERVLG